MVSALLGVVVGAVFEAVHAERRAVGRIQTRLDMAAHARAALDALRRDLSGALPDQPGGFVALAPEGHAPFPGVVAWLTTRRLSPLAGENGPDARQVEYRLEPETGADGPFALVCRSTLLGPTEPVPVPRLVLGPADRRTRELIAGRIESLRLRFHDGRTVHDTWPRRAGSTDPELPAQVQVELAMRAEPGMAPMKFQLAVGLPGRAPVKP